MKRICYKGCLSTAHWDIEKNVAVLDIKKGSSMQKYGWQSKEGIFLHPEEALFMIDQGILELMYNKLPVSLHEAYILLLPLLPSYEYYEVFAYLCRLGYVVKRHSKQNKLAESRDGESESKWGRGLGSPVKENVPDVNDETAEPMASGYLKNLWSEYPDQRPCIRPSEATSTAAVLSKLQVMELFKLKDIEYLEDGEPFKDKIDFDVFLSLTSKNQQLGRPRFRVVVCKYCDPPPTLYEMGCLTNESDGVSLKLAIVNDGTLTFFGIFDVDIPTILTVG